MEFSFESGIATATLRCSELADRAARTCPRRSTGQGESLVRHGVADVLVQPVKEKVQLGDVGVGPLPQCVTEELVALEHDLREEPGSEFGELKKPRPSVQRIGQTFDQPAFGEFGDLPARTRTVELGPFGDRRESLGSARVQPAENRELRHRHGRVPLVEDAAADALESQHSRQQLVAESGGQVFARHLRSRCVHYATIGASAYCPQPAFAQRAVRRVSDRVSRLRQQSGQRYVGGELVVVIDCARLARAAEFWCTVLGYEWEDAAAAGTGVEDRRYLSLVPSEGAGIEVLLQQVPESKVA